MTKKPLTIIKVCSNDFKPSQKDIERWRDIFDQAQQEKLQPIQTVSSAQSKIDEGIANKEIIVEQFQPSEESITLVKIGNEEYKPTVQDLEMWRKLFEEAEGDPDFKIIVHGSVNIRKYSI